MMTLSNRVFSFLSNLAWPLVAWSFLSVLLMECVPRAVAQTLPAANPISAIIPSTTFSLELEKVISLPDSLTGSNRFARIEQMTPALDGTDKIFVSDQRGRLYSFSVGDTSPSLFFDFQANIPNFRSGNQQSGLRGFAFHPDAHTVGAPGYRKLYTAVDIDTNNGSESHQSRVSEWTMNANGNVIASSKRDVLIQSQPRGDHNIGKIKFNPNLSPGDADYGNLYISFGDGGNYRSSQIGGSDTTLSPNGQDTTNRLGSILRINPLESGSSAFTVPADNPFVGQAGILPEIWAYGLRNPHHFSWDRSGDGDMLIADIGQSNIEEVNLGVAGANYGWSVREGTFDVTGRMPDNPTTSDVLPANHATDPYTYPVAQFDHDFDNTGQVNVAIAGGYVYRGSLIPELQGKYLFGSFGSDGEGPIYVVDVDQLTLRDDLTNVTTFHDGFLAPVQKLSLVDGDGQPTTMLDLIKDESGNNNQTRTDFRFGIDSDGEIYISSKKDGTIRRFVSTLMAGDYNRDGVVDAADFTVWRDTLGQSTDLRADGNGDNTITSADYNVWSTAFGNANPSSAFVPEPDGIAFLWMAIIAVATCRRRTHSQR